MSRFVLPLLCVLLVHIAAVVDRPEVCLAIFLGASIAGAIWVHVMHGPRPLLATYAAVAAVFAVLVALNVAGYSYLTYAVFVPPVVVNLGLSIVFGSTLRPGQKPLVTRFAELHHDDVLPEPLVAYTRRLTVVWTVLLAVMGIEAAVLAATVDLGTWSWIVNVLNPLILIVFFVAQFWYRHWRYREYGKVSIVHAMRKIWRDGRSHA